MRVIEPKNPEPDLLDSLYHSVNARPVDNHKDDADNRSRNDSIGVDIDHKRGPQGRPVEQTAPYYRSTRYIG
jgi:hypothetical protein